ncbi:hypothetical protein OFO12_01900 [Campylobacter sp. JMF_04 NA10]|uniref:hypothetical protein n=1 Tax=Campylobacter sp. JMF_04 NA10 TaxID=2983824 RepID=UPI0022E9C50E|nr:hypothetical protein [Campylobacter sp. JMF_04 NA10]MDA3076119.1 hypothetical protein [Campylobacter sp. JMF_04 NA10]
MRVRVEQILASEGIYKILFSHGLCGVFLELPKPISVGSGVEIGLKATQAFLARKKCEISAENEICAKISDIKFGEILSNLSFCKSGQNLEFDIIATTQSVRNLGLCVGDKIYIYANASAIFIEKIYD